MMNWDHRFNNLTSHFLFDLEAAVKYLEQDPDMKCILLGDAEEKNFSSGTDLDHLVRCAYS